MHTVATSLAMRSTNLPRCYGDKTDKTKLLALFLLLLVHYRIAVSPNNRYNIKP